MDAGPEPNTFRAGDYDTLVDSPIVAGNPAVYEFAVAGKSHYLVDVGEGGVWDGARAVGDLAKIVQKTADFWGPVPYDRYFFFNVIVGPNNGLEHKNSTVINIPLESTTSRDEYLEWLSAAAHEYFHAWNVKRLRPVELGPFDYENEVYKRDCGSPRVSPTITRICRMPVRALDRRGALRRAPENDCRPPDDSASRAAGGVGVL